MGVLDDVLGQMPDVGAGDGERIVLDVAPPDAPAIIGYTSGTTGDPKALPWTHANPIKCGADSHYHLDIHPREVVAWPTNLGWMMGPWLIYASFLNRATMALYYGAPNERGFGSFVQAAGINMLGVIPSLVRTWRRSGCMEGIDFSAVRVFCATGECSNCLLYTSDAADE